MFLYAKLLERYSIEASDGTIGRLEDVYFDDEKWSVRYFVVNTNPWLPGGKVLLSPISVKKVDFINEVIQVDLTKEQVKESPDIDFDKPVYRQKELEIHRHYGYTYYWPTAAIWGPKRYARDLAVVDDEDKHIYFDKNEENPNLRSAKEVMGKGKLTGYSISAYDDKFGEVTDLVIEDQTWTIRYFIIDTIKLLPSKKVVISTDWIKSIDWGNRTIYVDLTKEDVKNAPEYIDPIIDRKYEDLLYGYYRRPRYWE